MARQIVSSEWEAKAARIRDMEMEAYRAITRAKTLPLGSQERMALASRAFHLQQQAKAVRNAR